MNVPKNEDERKPGGPDRGISISRNR